jgi:hypothetical protein
MTEQEAIGMQNGEFVKSLYTTLYNAYITTTNPAQVAQAEQKFITMVKKARDARARALELLAQGE